MSLFVFLERIIMKNKYILTKEDIEEIIFKYQWSINNLSLDEILKQYPKYVEEDYTLLEE